MWSLLLLSGCNLNLADLLPPLTLDHLVIRDLTYDRLDADLAFLVEEERDPEGVADMAYAMEVGGDAVAGGDTSDTEVDGSVILAPVEVEIGELPGWAELVGRDDVVPFEVTGHYAYRSGGVNLDFVLIGSGELPAPRAPDLDATSIGDGSLRIAVVNRDPTSIALQVREASVRIAGDEVADGTPPPLMGIPSEMQGELRFPLSRVDPTWGDAVDVEVTLDLEVETAFGPIPFPVARTFQRVSIQP